MKILGATKSQRITSLVKSIIANSTDEIRYDEVTRQAHDELREFMFQNVYYAPATNQEKDKACHIVEYLYNYYLSNPEKMPELYRVIAADESPEIAVCDYISSMTDDFAIDRFTELCIPKSWKRIGGTGHD